MTFDLNKMSRLIKEKFDNFGLSLDKNQIDGDFVNFNADLTIKKLNNASIFYVGEIGNHGYGKFEAVFDEFLINEDSLVAVNAFNNSYDLVKAYVSRRGNAGKYYLVLSRSVQYVESEETMVTQATRLLNDIIDEKTVESIRELLTYLK